MAQALQSGASETKRSRASELSETSRTASGMGERRKGSLGREMSRGWRRAWKSRLPSVDIAKQSQEHLVLTLETKVLLSPVRLIITCYSRKLIIEPSEKFAIFCADFVCVFSLFMPVMALESYKTTREKFPSFALHLLYSIFI